MNFSEALEGLRMGASVSREAWLKSPAKPYVKLQMPDKYSKMTKPYLYMVKNEGKDVFPLDMSCESILAEDWVIV